MSDQLLWEYNCRDVEATMEVYTHQKSFTSSFFPQLEMSMGMFYPVLKAMIHGVKLDLSNKTRISRELERVIEDKESTLRHLLSSPQLNFSSPTQLKDLFYNVFQLRPVKDRKTGSISASESALIEATKDEPILRYVVNELNFLRSLYVFYRTFSKARIDSDGHIRSSFNPAGTHTFRFSSSKSIWGTGFNFQNVPKGSPGLPNIRELFIPSSPELVFWDGDLSRADLYIVACEAREPVMLEALQKGVDLHILNAFVIQGREPPPLDQLVESHSEYQKHRSDVGAWRQLAKTWAHGKNYGGSDRTMAKSAGIIVAESEKASSHYFGFFQGLAKWHSLTLEKLRNREPIINPYGFKTQFYGDPKRDLNEALAWVPQSTVGIHINRIWSHLYRNYPSIKVLIQVHDSLAGEGPSSNEFWASVKDDIIKNIRVPYDWISGGLSIPWTPKTGKNWGDACA